MAMASARLLSRRVCRTALSSLSNSTHSTAPSPALYSADEALALSRRLCSFSLANADSDRSVTLRSLPNFVPFSRVYSTDAVEGFSEEQNENVTSQEAVKEAIKPPPRPFKLNNEQRELAEEIGYRVVDRYTEEDFGKNKRPKAFAVVQIGSHQFKVSPNDLIYTEKLKYCDINDKLMLNKVLLLGSKDQTIIGRPTVPKAAVFAVVEEHALDEKVIIFKKKRRKNYRRTTGHRQELTRLRILEIKGINVETAPPTPLRKAKATPAVEADETRRSVSKIEESPTPVLA